MPQQYPLQQQQQPYVTETYMPSNNNTSNMFTTARQPVYNNYPQHSTYQPPQPQPSNSSPTNSKPDFQRFYGPVS